MSKVGTLSSTPVMPRSLASTERAQRPVARQDVAQQSPKGYSRQDSFESLRTTSPDDTTKGGPSNGTGAFRRIGVPGDGGG
jgi:hypothetical protein